MIADKCKTKEDLVLGNGEIEIGWLLLGIGIGLALKYGGGGTGKGVTCTCF